MSAPHVTDHALIRFLERAGDLDVEAVRRALERGLSRAHTAARSLSDSNYLVKLDGLTYLVSGDNVVTVLTDPPPAYRARMVSEPVGEAERQ